MSDDTPLTVQTIIQILSTPPVSLSMRKALDAAKILMPTKPTALSLSKLTEKSMKDMGLKESETRKAIRAGWPKVVQGKGKQKEIKVGLPSPPKKRKTGSGRSDMFEIHDPDAEASSSSAAIDLSVAQLDFGEEIPEEKLMKVSVTVNRAPVMTAWCLIICLRLGFSKEEALSLASVYTEMNANARAIAIGKVPAPKGPTLEDELRRPDNTLPYVDLMGRRIPVVAREDETWRAILNSGEICKPARAAKYLLSSFSSSLPSVLRSLTLLAESHPPLTLQTDQGGFSLYTLFRPDPPPPMESTTSTVASVSVEGKGKGKQEMSWGGKGVMKMETVLSLRGVEVREGVKKEEEGEEEEGEEEEEEEEEEEDVKPSTSKRPRRAATNSPRKKIVYKEDEDDDEEAVAPKVEVKEEDEDEMFWGDLKDEDLPVDI